MGMGGAGSVIMFVVSLVGWTIVTLVFLLFAAHYFLATIIDSTAGCDEVTFDSDTVLDRWWKPIFCFWVLAFWVVPIAVLLAPLMIRLPEVAAILLVAILWFLFPLGIISAPRVAPLDLCLAPGNRVADAVPIRRSGLCSSHHAAVVHLRGGTRVGDVHAQLRMGGAGGVRGADGHAALWRGTGAASPGWRSTSPPRRKNDAAKPGGSPPSAGFSGKVGPRRTVPPRRWKSRRWQKSSQRRRKEWRRFAGRVSPCLSGGSAERRRRGHRCWPCAEAHYRTGGRRRGRMVHEQEAVPDYRRGEPIFRGRNAPPLMRGRSQTPTSRSRSCGITMKKHARRKNARKKPRLSCHICRRRQARKYRRFSPRSARRMGVHDLPADAAGLVQPCLPHVRGTVFPVIAGALLSRILTRILFRVTEDARPVPARSRSPSARLDLARNSCRA